VKRTITLIALALIAWIGYQIYAAGRDETPPPSPQPVLMRKGKAHGERLSTPSWSIEYDNVVGNADQSLLNLEGVHNGVFYRNGKPYLHLRAAHVTVNTITHDFTASGPFHVETVDHTHFRALDTTQAAWNQTSKRLFLPKKTTIAAGPNAKPLIADGITVDVDKGDVHMEHVRGALSP
jgi:hypothetical protein